ncbi:3-hydroxyisobutyrate dehydrogenase-like beta-hydroxyacid dehydrogenase [Nocardioides thalensis]|uniref:3-hydroxyisobutyrate dehydrogenase-like beta-hydroxyacid dehydrogenase n=1 Tax=Nocardioides thalensis TaxID=1914755 RepID=A0A853C754_9ACTN|nr:NAD(P)-binding domain-containing protein [Nocardioides thalensis]NYJ03069.1 3-hydroxyisobutyrate dehydrogenase-like beta-hydroxyacid dehydrogenase [Nocardioides thalensis]
MTTNTDDTTTPLVPVTVLGTGAMGSALARTFLDRGHAVTVWNRTESKAAPLLAAGAAWRPTPAEAAAASPLVVVCLLDQTAVDDVLAAVGGAIDRRVLVNLTSGSPAHARSAASRVTGWGGEYVDGGIMADPSDIGSDRARLSFSGSRTAYDTHEPTLRELGTAVYYGDDPGLAAVEFLAQVGAGYELLIGLLHTLRLVQTEGADVAAFAERFAQSLEDGYPQVVRAIGKAVRDGDYPPDLGPLSVQAPLMDDLVAHRRSLGVDDTRMTEVRELMNARVAAGHGDEGLAGVFELLRPEKGSAG